MIVILNINHSSHNIWNFIRSNIGGLATDCINSIADELELLQSGAKPSVYRIYLKRSTSQVTHLFRCA